MRAQPIEAPKQTNTPIFIRQSQSLSPSLALQSLSTSYRVTMRAQPFEAYKPINTPTFFKCHGRSRLHLPCRVFRQSALFWLPLQLGSVRLGRHSPTEAVSHNNLNLTLYNPSPLLFTHHRNHLPLPSSKSLDLPLIMDSADLIVNQAEAERNSFVKLFNIDGRVSTFVPLEQEAGDGDSDGDSDGNLKFGDAVPAYLKVSPDCTRCVRHILTLHLYRNPGTPRAFTVTRFRPV